MIAKGGANTRSGKKRARSARQGIAIKIKSIIVSMSIGAFLSFKARPRSNILVYRRILAILQYLPELLGVLLFLLVYSRKLFLPSHLQAR